MQVSETQLDLQGDKNTTPCINCIGPGLRVEEE